MAVKIRLTRMGRKKRPFYRIVVADERAPRDGRYIEAIGYYNPIENPPVIQINEPSANLWLDKGAKPSDTVRSLMRKEGVLFRRSLNKKGLDEAQIAEEMKKWEAVQVQKQQELEKKAADKKAKVADKTKEEPKEEPAEATEAEVKADATEEAAPEPVETAEEEPKKEVKAEAASDETPAEEAKEADASEEATEEKPSE